MVIIIFKMKSVLSPVDFQILNNWIQQKQQVGLSQFSRAIQSLGNEFLCEWDGNTFYIYRSGNKDKGMQFVIGTERNELKNVAMREMDELDERLRWIEDNFVPSTDLRAAIDNNSNDIESLQQQIADLENKGMQKGDMKLQWSDEFANRLELSGKDSAEFAIVTARSGLTSEERGFPIRINVTETDKSTEYWCRLGAIQVEGVDVWGESPMGGIPISSTNSLALHNCFIQGKVTMVDGEFTAPNIYNKAEVDAKISNHTHNYAEKDHDHEQIGLNKTNIENLQIAVDTLLNFRFYNKTLVDEQHAELRKNLDAKTIIQNREVQNILGNIDLTPIRTQLLNLFDEWGIREH